MQPFICILFVIVAICLRGGISFNFLKEIRTNDLIKSPVLLNNVGRDVKSSHYGSHFILNPDGSFLIGAPNVANAFKPSAQPLKTAKNGLENATGAIYSCPPPKNLNNTTCTPKSNIPAKRIGANFHFEPNTPSVVCSPSQTLSCKSLGLNLAPGFCYRTNRIHPDVWRASADMKKQQSCPPPALQPTDIIFVLDGSGSIGRNFNKVKDWTITVANGFNLSTGLTHVGVIQYSHWFSGVNIQGQKYIKTEIPLGKTTYSEFKTKMEKIEFQGYTTHTGHALEKTKLDFVNDGRKNATKVMVLLTDGRSDDSDVLTKNADSLRKMGVITFSVGVGNIKQEELRIIASGNISSDKGVFKVGDFDALSGISKSLQQSILKSVLEGTRNNSVASTKMEYSEQGFAINIGKKTRHSNGALYLGAVGAYDWSGCVIKYDSVDDDTADIPKFADVQMVLPNKTKASYLGYSVTSGYFQGGSVEYVASGAPRYNLKGAVVIYKPVKDKAEFVGAKTIYGPKHLRQDMHGSYFGASLLAVDINRDGKHDLLVGAPLFIDGSGYDEGRVFVFMGQPSNSIGTWASDNFEPVQLTGTKLAGGRFGTAMANAGDMNNDGYNDVIVGAPLAHEGGGAVYVYHGMATGINTKVKQVILASDIQGVKLQYFGQSLQGGVDLDGNQYPDIAVGAPKSDMVLIFRSKPVVKVEATNVKFIPNELKILQCFQKPNRDCLSVKVCFKASGKNIEDTIGISYNITLDSGLAAGARKRIEFRTNENDTSGAETKSLTATLNSDSTENCETFEVYLRKNVFDFDTPLEATVNFDLLSAHTMKPMSSVRDPDEISTVKDQATFTKDCGDNGCQYNLGITGTMTIPRYSMTLNGSNTDLSQGGKVLVVAADTAKQDIILTGNLSNTGENAFDTVMIMNHSSYIGVTKFQTTGSSHNGKDSCLVEDPLLSSVNGDMKSVVYRYNFDKAFGSIMQKDNWCAFTITMHVSKTAINNGNYKNFTVNLEATTRDTSPTSQEVDSSNNNFPEGRDMKYRSDITVNKKSDEANVAFNFTEDPLTISSVKQIGNNTSDVEMRFEVNGLGFASIPQTDMKLTYPLKSMSGNRILYLYEVLCEAPGSVSCTCDRSNVNIYNLSLEFATQNLTNSTETYDMYPTTTSVDQSVYDCTQNSASDTCGTVSCSAFGLGALDKVTFFAKFRFWTQDIRFNGTNLTEIETRSLFSVTTENSKYIITNDGSPVATKYQQIVISAEKYFPKQVNPTQDNLWIYILAAVGGLLLLIALVALMYKLGFFKSKYAEMKKDAQGMEEDFDMANGDNASTTDIIN